MLNDFFGVDYGVNLSSAEKKVFKKFDVRGCDNVSKILGTLTSRVFKIDKVPSKFQIWLNNYIRNNAFPFLHPLSITNQYIKLDSSLDSNIKLEKSVLEFLSGCESSMFIPKILDSFSENGLEAILIKGVEGGDNLVCLPDGFSMDKSFFRVELDNSFENLCTNLHVLYKDLKKFDVSEFSQLDSFPSLDVLEKRLSTSSRNNGGIEFCDDNLLLFYEKCLVDYKILKDSENRICHRDLRFDKNLFSNDFRMYFGDWGMVGNDTRLVDLVKLTSAYDFDKSSECVDSCFENSDFNILFDNRLDFRRETFKVAFMDSLKYFSYMIEKPCEFEKKRINYYLDKTIFLNSILNE